MAQLTVEQTFQMAVQHHQAGQLAQAEQLYRQILAQQPNHVEALHRLGVIAAQVWRNDAAVELIGRAIALRPGYFEAHGDLGNVLQARGQLDEAIAAYRRAIALKSNHPETHYNLGRALQARGQLDEAIAAYRQAIALKPNLLEAHNNLGSALQVQGQLNEATVAFRQAISLKPNYPEAHINLGIARRAGGRLDEAIAAYRQAISLNPNYAEARYNLGNALKDKGQLDEAIAAFRQAIALKPSYAEAHNNLGNALIAQDRLDDAIAAYRQAIARNPNYPEAHNNLGSALQAGGRFDESIAVCRAAIALNSNYAEAHNNLALALLIRGDFAQGWKEYEWRWQCKDFTTFRPSFTQPSWDGRPLAGARLLLHGEQGVGDTIQFIRYLPLLDRQDGQVTIECQAELLPLLQNMDGDYSFIARGQPLPDFDFHCPLMSLPRVFQTTFETIPRQAPYLHADAEIAGKFRDRLAEDSHSLKVGLVWAGRKEHPNNRNRSMELSAFAPIARLPGVSIYSLQKGESADQAANPPGGLHLIDWTNELHDFADTAALIANLDLIISVDTSVVHLAGAMGKPVWVLLPFVPDWRWMLQREDSPWYPTMRLFRQSSVGDWESVIQRIGKSLNDLALQRGH